MTLGAIPCWKSILGEICAVLCGCYVVEFSAWLLLQYMYFRVLNCIYIAHKFLKNFIGQNLKFSTELCGYHNLP